MTLLQWSYFGKHLLPKIHPLTDKKVEDHSLFMFTVNNDGQLLNKMYTELAIGFLGLKVLDVGVLIMEDPNQVLDKKQLMKLPDVLRWNLIWLS